MDEELDLLDLFFAFWKRKTWFILAIFIGAFLGIVYTKYMVVPKYTSFATLLLAKNSSVTSENANMITDEAITQSDITLNQKLISTYSEIMKSKRVSNTVIDNLGLDMSYEEIIKCINVSAVKDADVIKLSITTKDPALSASIANEMTEVFTTVVSERYNLQNIYVLDEAENDEEPVNVSLVKNIVIFAAIAFVLVAGVVFVIYYFDNTVKSEEDIKKLTDLPVLGIIPNVEVKGGKKDA
ncbi:MAG: hypothetical protein J6C46_11235 [Clostridia bacterium]|nr:hypothetical protein [Clostridia bacterium]